VTVSTDDENPLADRMAVLLKHARETLAGLTGPALAPYGIDGRSLAVLTVLAGPRPLSQLEAAQRLGVDRTTMVALIDGLEDKELVRRSPDPGDRRRNIVDLTERGRQVFERATAASADAERRFLAPLGEREVATLKAALRSLIDGTTPPGPGHRTAG
jgi:DNA-binding MarR family transcriptional regulator